MTLIDLSTNDCGKIVGYTKSSKPFRKKLLAMGLLPGTEFTVTRYAPLGDPIQLLVRNCSVALRKIDAEILLVEKITKCNKGCC